MACGSGRTPPRARSFVSREREREVTERIIPEEVHARPRPREVIGTALRTYRQQFRRVAGTAFLVFGAVAAIDAFATVLVIDRHVSRPEGAAITSAAASVFAMVGVVVYAGILDKVVGAHLHGHPDLSVREIWSVLPLGRHAGRRPATGNRNPRRPGPVRGPGRGHLHPVVARRASDHDRRPLGTVRASTLMATRASVFLAAAVLVTVRLQVEQAAFARDQATTSSSTSFPASLPPQRTARHARRLRRRTRRGRPGL